MILKVPWQLLPIPVKVSSESGEGVQGRSGAKRRWGDGIVTQLDNIGQEREWVINIISFLWVVPT